MEGLTLNILNFLTPFSPEPELFQQQVKTASVTNTDYTGQGVFIDLAVPKEVQSFSQQRYSIEEYPKCFLRHPELSAGALAILWVNQGKIDTLECYTFEGDWPKDESHFVIEIYG